VSAGKPGIQLQLQLQQIWCQLSRVASRSLLGPFQQRATAKARRARAASGTWTHVPGEYDRLIRVLVRGPNSLVSVSDQVVLSGDGA